MAKRCVNCKMWAMKNSDYCLNHNPNKKAITNLLPDGTRLPKNYSLRTIQGIKNACIKALRGLFNNEEPRKSGRLPSSSHTGNGWNTSMPYANGRL